MVTSSWQRTKQGFPIPSATTLALLPSNPLSPACRK
jgi:hypothetical protein